MERQPTDDEVVRRAIDREVELVDGAIELVASGGSPRATVGGLRLTEAVIDVLRAHAAARGVIVEVLWAADETSNDVMVRRPDGH